MSKRSYTKQFKLDAVRLAIEGEETTAQTANNLGINQGSLYQWVAKYRSEVMQSGVSLSPDEEVKQLRKEVARLRQEREILKKAAAFFAKETL